MGHVRTLRSNSVQEAADKYPAIRATVNLAKKLKYPLFAHLCRVNSHGRISKHFFAVPGEIEGKIKYESNSIIYGMLRTFAEAQRKYGETLKKLED